VRVVKGIQEVAAAAAGQAIHAGPAEEVVVARPACQLVVAGAPVQSLRDECVFAVHRVGPAAAVVSHPFNPVRGVDPLVAAVGRVGYVYVFPGGRGRLAAGGDGHVRVGVVGVHVDGAEGVGGIVNGRHFAGFELLDPESGGGRRAAHGTVPFWVQRCRRDLAD